MKRQARLLLLLPLMLLAAPAYPQKTTVYEYDALGRLIKVTIATPPPPPSTQGTKVIVVPLLGYIVIPIN